MNTDVTTAAATKPAGEAPRTRGGEAWRRLRANRLAHAGAWILLALALACLLFPLLPVMDSDTQTLANANLPPSASHLFGTDALGRDLLARVLEGGRISLGVGLAGTLVSLVIGVSYGMAAGYKGGWLDSAMMRGVDILNALPFTLFVILLTAVFSDLPGFGRLLLMFIAIGAVEWLGMARIIRAQTLALRDQDFVNASRVLGQGTLGILRLHILPNLLGTIAIYATLTVPRVMLLESFLSFLGLGAELSWGSLIRDGADAMEASPWLLVFPSIFFSLTLFCLNFLGDGLRDALDPKARR